MNNYLKILFFLSTIFMIILTPIILVILVENKSTLNASELQVYTKDLPLSKFFNEKEIFLIKNGVDHKQLEFIDYISYKESSYNYQAVNEDTGAIGLFQLNPNWHEIPEGYIDSPDIQMQWANEYAIERYKSWSNAYLFHKENGWW